MAKDMIKNLVRGVFDKDYRFISAKYRAKCVNMTDMEIVSKMYKAFMEKEIDLENPITFNEKIQWLKLYDHNPIYHIMSDKYAVREYIANTIGEKYLIPLVGGPWKNFDEIDFDVLPNKFVLKCTHDSGGVFVCKDKSIINLKKLRKQFNYYMSKDYYIYGREWAYKGINPQIICEEYIEDESHFELKDYKIFAFDGNPFLIQVDFDRFSNHKRNLYTTDWTYVDATIKYPTDPNHIIDKPEKLEEMLELSSKLSKGYPHIRTDFYYVEGKIFFGELTLYHGSGTESFSSKALEVEMGNRINLDLAYREENE